MEKYVERNCKTHGITSYILEGSGYYRCRKCRVERVSNYRRNFKTKCLEYKGNKCERCGYNKCNTALHFHHTNADKEFGLSSKGNTISWERAKKEMDKCQLLCANCHAEVHSK